MDGTRNMEQNNNFKIPMMEYLLYTFIVLFVAFGCAKKAAIMSFRDTVFLSDSILLGKIVTINKTDYSVNVEINDIIKNKYNNDIVKFYYSGNNGDLYCGGKVLATGEEYFFFLYRDKVDYYLFGGNHSCYHVSTDGQVSFEGNYISVEDFIGKVNKAEKEKPSYYK